MVKDSKTTALNIPNAQHLHRTVRSHILGIYSCFDRVIVRGYLHNLFTTGGLIHFLRSSGFTKFTDGVMRIFTDQLNNHIKKFAEKHKIDLLWQPSVDGGKDGTKQDYVEKQYVRKSDKKKAISSTTSSPTSNGHVLSAHANLKRRTVELMTRSIPAAN